MKKIMFNTPLGLEQAVLDGRKTMTRRILTTHIHNLIDFKAYLEGDNECAGEFENGWIDWKLVMPYQIGETIAIAQSYHTLNKSGYVAPEWCEHTCESSAGYNNKMFVRADLMPHHICITDMRLEYLQNISDEDCLREGIYAHTVQLDETPGIKPHTSYAYNMLQGSNIKRWWYQTPREAFAALIDKLSGKGTWASNPWVVAYTFKRL